MLATGKIRRFPIEMQLKDKWRLVFYITVSGVVFVASLVAWWLGEDAAPGIFIGGLFGLTGHWMATAVSSMHLQKSKELQVINYLESHGYNGNSGELKFVPKIHRLLRFDSQNVSLDPMGVESLEVRGAFYVLKK